MVRECAESWRDACERAGSRASAWARAGTLCRINGSGRSTAKTLPDRPVRLIRFRPVQPEGFGVDLLPAAQARTARPGTHAGPPAPRGSSWPIEPQASQQFVIGRAVAKITRCDQPILANNEIGAVQGHLFPLGTAGPRPHP